METLLLNIDELLNVLLESLGIYGPILGSFLILVESILPVLPISVFITLNFYTFGNTLGFILSYVLTVIGCNIAFCLCRRIMQNRFAYLVKKFDKSKALKLIDKFSNIKLTNLVIVLAFPFTPAFLVNIFSGVSNMPHKKFLIATIISKPFMVYFWGYIGITLMESLTNPKQLIKIAAIMIIAYLISKLINKKFELD